MLFGGKVIRPQKSDGSADEEVVNDVWTWDGSGWTKAG